MPTARLLELVSEYEQALSAKRPEESFYPLFCARDRLARLIERQAGFTLSELTRIAELDAKLRALLQRPASPDLHQARELLQPPKSHWWWHYAKHESVWWTIIAVFLFTLSLALITDFTRRLLNSDPDTAGIAAIATQAALAIAASSAFTAAGRRILGKLALRFHIPAHKRSLSQFAFAAFLFGLIFLGWKYGPGWLAVRANDKAVSSNDPQEKFRLYSRAISLDPELAHAHFNLGEVLENDYRYSEAAAQYEKAVLSDPLDQKAYNNLARMFLLSKQPLEALRAIDDAQRILCNDSKTKATIDKNLAWAEYELGFYQRAEQDARVAIQIRPHYAPSYCILGKILKSLGKAADARQTWQLFTDFYSATNPNVIKIEPDCVRLAAEALSPTK